MRMRLTDAIEHQRLQFLLPSNSLNCNQIVHIRVLTMGIIGSYVMRTLPPCRANIKRGIQQANGL